MSTILEAVVVLLQVVSVATLVYGLIISTDNGLERALASVKGRLGAGLVGKYVGAQRLVRG